MCDLKKINYNKVNSNFFLSVSKVCASLTRGGGDLSSTMPVCVCPKLKDMGPISASSE